MFRSRPFALALIFDWFFLVYISISLYVCGEVWSCVDWIYIMWSSHFECYQKKKPHSHKWKKKKKRTRGAYLILTTLLIYLWFGIHPTFTIPLLQNKHTSGDLLRFFRLCTLSSTSASLYSSIDFIRDPKSIMYIARWIKFGKKKSLLHAHSRLRISYFVYQVKIVDF